MTGASPSAPSGGRRTARGGGPTGSGGSANTRTTTTTRCPVVTAVRQLLLHLQDRVAVFVKSNHQQALRMVVMVLWL